ncbi:Pentatricopeptide repeat-containing protein [Nymphaea thermarum]|nr:Pentatricopeptide repeat-containing protein [Nymphaea thermarum]
MHHVCDLWELKPRLFYSFRSPNSPSLASILHDVKELKSLHQIHANVITSGLQQNVFLSNRLLNACFSCGDSTTAEEIFRRMTYKNVVSWTIMVNGYWKHGCPFNSVNAFREMVSAGVLPNSVTIASILPACCDLGLPTAGRLVHSYMIVREMGCLIQGTLIHAHVIKYGFEKSSHVATLLMDMYGKCGNVEDASQVFDLSPCKDVVSWSTILSIFADLGHGHEAVELFNEMMAAGLPFDSVSLMEYLSLCSRLGALSQGKCLHGLMTKIGLETDTPVGTALIDMYAKCGNLSSARSFFNQMDIKDVICWNAMITGCGINGCGDEAIGLFWQMNSLGFQPNNSTFLSILSACSHAGLVKHGLQIFEHMTNETTLVPDMQHFACLIDLLARAGHLRAAYQLVKSLSLEQDVGVLGALLGACKIYGEIAFGAEIARKFFELDLSDAGYYVLLSNWYAGLKDWNRVEMVQDLLRLKGLKKEPGCSMIDIDGSFHAFVFEDTY